MPGPQENGRLDPFEFIGLSTGFNANLMDLIFLGWSDSVRLTQTYSSSLATMEMIRVCSVILLQSTLNTSTQQGKVKSSNREAGSLLITKSISFNSFALKDLFEFGFSEKRTNRQTSFQGILLWQIQTNSLHGFPNCTELIWPHRLTEGEKPVCYLGGGAKPRMRPHSFEGFSRLTHLHTYKAGLL